MTDDIVVRADVAAEPGAVWHALLATGRLSENGRKLVLGDGGSLRLRAVAPGVGLRGTARWLDVDYRVTVHLVSVDRGTQVLVTAIDVTSSARPAIRRRQARRAATRDLRRLLDVVSQEAPGAGTAEGAPAA